MRIPDLRFYTFDFVLLHVEHHFSSVNWNICYNDIGTFEAHFDLQSEALPIVMEQDYLIVVQGQQAAVVVGKRLGEDLAVYGRTCNWLLTKRVIDVFEKGEQPAEQVVNQAVKTAFSDVPVILAPPTEDVLLEAAEQDNKRELFSMVQEILEQAGLGHTLEFEPIGKHWVFRILRGRNNNPLTVSVSNRNAYDMTIEHDLLDLCTEGWYKQKLEDGGEQWVQLKGTSPQTGMRRWEGLLSGESESEAAASLLAMRRAEAVQGNTFGITYDEDYALGDIVVVQYQAGDYKKTARKRVTGVNLWYESNGCGQQPIFEEVEENGVQE